jgi:hypothetical protein
MITGAFSDSEFIEYQNIEDLKQSLLAVMNKLK